MAQLTLYYWNNDNKPKFSIGINNIHIDGLNSIDLHCDVLDGERKCTFKMEGDLAPFLSTIDKLEESKK